MDFRNIDWFSAKPSRERIIIGVGVIALVAGGFALGRMGSGDSAPPAGNAAAASEAAAPAGVTAAAQGLVPLAPLDSGTCRTFAPEGWRIADQNKDGTVLTTVSPDGRMAASYGGTALSSAHAAGVYGDQFRTPESVARYMAGILTREEVQMDGPPEPVGVYQAWHFTTATHAGYLLLYRFDVPADPGGFGVIVRIAIGAAGDPKSVGVAGAVAAATRCNAVLHPSNGPVYHAPREDHGAGTTVAGGDADMAGTYNAQLGTGWVHDPNTGQNYNVDVTGDWRENGPDGPGYYKQNGNDVTKLVAGLQ